MGIMKRLMFIFTLMACVLLSVVAFGQNLLVSYLVDYQPQKNDSHREVDEWVLNYDSEKHESLFLPKNTEPKDRFNTLVFKKISKNQWAILQPVFNRYYRTPYAEQPAWILHTEKKEILGYVVHRATTHLGGRKWEAWFCRELPFADGPYKFSGLPGLVLEVSSEDKEYKFTANGIEQSKQNIVMLNFTFINNEDFTMLKNKSFNDPSGQMTSIMKASNLNVSVSFNGNEISSQRLNESLNETYRQWAEKHNNPIEIGDIWFY